MKIALFHNLPSGGAKRHTREQLRELASRGYWIEEFVPDSADLTFFSFTAYTRRQHLFAAPQPFPIQQRIPLLTPYLNTLHGLGLLRETEALNQRIARAIDQQGVNLVLVKDCNIIGNPYILKYLHTPCIFQCHHGMSHQITPSPSDNNKIEISRIIKQIYYRPAQEIFQRKYVHDEIQNIQSAGRVLTNSQHARALLKNYYQVDAQVVYPGINRDTFWPRELERKNYVLTVGALTYQKGHRFLVEALGCLSPSHRPSLVIVANSSDPIEKEHVQQLAQVNGVDLTIEQISDDARMAEIYGQARVFVYAPIREALGMAPLEAMACGTPVVAVGEAGVCETVVNDVTGFLVRRDPQEFADALARLLSNRELHQQFSAGAVDHVRSNWSWQTAVDRLEDQFRTLLNIQ